MRDQRWQIYILCTHSGAVCLNAGAALYIAGKAASIEAGVKMAEQLIDSGAALKKLEEFIEKSNQE